MGEYDDALSLRRPGGAILIDGIQVADTVQCVHCGGHFVMRRGSGITRGFCTNCNGLTCGPTCASTCRPLEQWLDQREKAGRR